MSVVKNNRRRNRANGSSQRATTRLAQQSASSNRLTSTSASTKSKKPPGHVRQDAQGGMLYWRPEERKWIPAVYHYEIREKLIRMAAAGNNDEYRHPRKRGRKHLDVTSFLESQKDWDFERDNGWIGLEILYMFDPINSPKPTYQILPMYDDERIVLDLNNHPVRMFRDIPLTLSSKVDAGLITVIKRLDQRIGWDDFVARIPKDSGKEKPLTDTALSERSRRWRNINCVTPWRDRWGSKAMPEFLWARMSPAARRANSTRELSKLTKEDLALLKLANEGIHHGRRRKAANPRGPKQQAPLLSWVQETPRTSSMDLCGDMGSQHPYVGSMHNHVYEHQTLFDPAYPSPEGSFGDMAPYAPHWPPGAMDSYIPVDPVLQPDMANPVFGAYASSSGTQTVTPTEASFTASNQLLPPSQAWGGFPLTYPQIDYRIFRPQTPEEIIDIQAALVLTRDAFGLWTRSFCPPTSVTESYLYQVQEIENSLFHHWMHVLGNPAPLPTLTVYRDPWRSGFKDWIGAMGVGGEGLMFERIPSKEGEGRTMVAVVAMAG